MMGCVSFGSVSCPAPPILYFILGAEPALNNLSKFRGPPHRPIKTGDVELIKQNANHALTGIDDCLEQISNCYNVVPTNTQDQWYLALSTLGTDLCKLALKQSSNE